jgi:hypothetical protein
MVIPRNLNLNFRFQIRLVTAVTGNPNPPSGFFYYRKPKYWSCPPRIRAETFVATAPRAFHLLFTQVTTAHSLSQMLARVLCVVQPYPASTFPTVDLLAHRA